MTLYQRPDEHVFAEGARPGEVQPFPDLSRGWGVTFDQTGGIPPMEWFNFIGKRADEAIRYLMQRGLPEWAETEDYPEGSYTQYAGKTYRAKVENKGKTPSTHLAEWEEWGLTREALDQSFHPKNGKLAWPKITDKPSTLAGYGITDAAPLSSPALIGTPIAPTPPTDNDSEQLATTAFVHAVGQRYITPEQGDTRYRKREEPLFPERKPDHQIFPNGLLLQWGGVDILTGQNQWVTFPIAFSDDSFRVWMTDYGPGCHPVGAVTQRGKPTGFNAFGRNMHTHEFSRTTAHWLALGHLRTAGE